MSRAAKFPEQPPGVRSKIDVAVDAINAAKKINDALQGQYAIGSPSWNQCEQADEKLHEALAALGD